MEAIKNLLGRFRQSAAIILIGFFLIIYIAFGLIYWQQGARQKELGDQSAKISLIVVKPLPSQAKLQAEYDTINNYLAMTDIEGPDINAKAIDVIVGIAEKSGIAIDPESVRVLSAARRDEKVGGGTYQVLSFRNISVHGDYGNIMAFISDLDSGTTRGTMVLKKVTINQIEVGGEGEEVTRTETAATLDVDLYTKPGG
jgi:hypothetical protein